MILDPFRSLLASPRERTALDLPAVPEESAAPRSLLPDDAEGFEVFALCDGGEHDAPANGQPCPRCFPMTTCKEE